MKLNKNNKAFFVPTVFVFTAILLGFIGIQALHILSYTQLITAKESQIYVNSGFKQAKAIVNNDIIAGAGGTCGELVAKNLKTINRENYTVTVKKTCLQIPGEGQPDELKKLYEPFEQIIYNSFNHIPNELFATVKGYVKTLNISEFIEDSADKMELIVSLFSANLIAISQETVELLVDEIKEEQFDHWIIYEVLVTTSTEKQQLLVVFNRTDQKLIQILYTN